jgi:acid stress-induced BolA-like protein IbaG/YrbA
MMTNEDLERTLKQLPLTDVVVRIEGRPGHLVAEVSSPDFSGKDESVRQQDVWEHLVNTLTDEQRVEVEFVFTLTPEEMREVEEGARSSA